MATIGARVKTATLETCAKRKSTNACRRRVRTTAPVWISKQSTNVSVDRHTVESTARAVSIVFCTQTHGRTFIVHEKAQLRFENHHEAYMVQNSALKNIPLFAMFSNLYTDMRAALISFYTVGIARSAIDKITCGFVEIKT